MPKLLLVPLALAFFALHVRAQDVANAKDSLSQISVPSLSKVYSYAMPLKQRLDKKSEKILAKMAKQEARIIAKLKGKDSISALTIQQNASSAYQQLKSKLSNPSYSQYIPRLDSISTSLKFLGQNSQLLSNVSDAKEKLGDAMNRVKGLEGSLQQAEEIRKFLRERKEYLKDQIAKLGLARQFKKLNKQIYYYSQQLNDYKNALHDPKKAGRKILDALSKVKFFQDFMRRNSLLASLFRMPGDPNDPSYMASLSGLQTRTQVNNLIQAQLSVGGPNGMGQLQQSFQQAQSQLNQLKDKILHTGGSSSDDVVPDFKPNTQKTKTFWQRLEYGTNVQSQKATNFFPVTSDIGLSMGYKINDQSVIGIGASYKLGFGRGWNHISLSNEGVGLRSFIDLKLKGSLWLSGGFEQNYRTAFSDFSQLRDKDAWQKSGLLGLSKSIPVKSKFFNKTKLQLLWDFLSYQQVPRTQSVVFRIGYQF